MPFLGWFECVCFRQRENQGQISVLRGGARYCCERVRVRDAEREGESGTAVGKLGPDPGPPMEHSPLPLPESFLLCFCVFSSFSVRLGGEGGEFS